MNNLLSQALSIIPQSSFQVQNFTGSTINNLGIRVPVWSTAENAFGIVQAVKNSTYQQLGLEFGKKYIAVWSNTDLKGLDDQGVSDQVIYNGKTFNVVNSAADWKTYNGWNAAICAEVKS